jgi:AAA domain
MKTQFSWDPDEYERDVFKMFEYVKPNRHERPVRALPLTFFDELSDNPTAKPWIIKNVIARDETSSWIAPPGKGKSALLTDIAVHSAAFKHWRGYRTKDRSGVVYFALERARLVHRRLLAHKRRDELGSLPIAVVGEVIDLLNRNCVDAIIATISEAEQQFGCEVGLAIFDTYSKGIAAGGGDEDKAKDQNIVQANLRRIFDQGRHIHIAGIGHTGKDESRGERGSNARLADVDLQVQITGDIIKTATVTKANDQPEGLLTTFRLEPYDFGSDQDGDSFQTFIVAPEVFIGDQGEQAKRPSKMTDRQRLALRALSEVTLANGRTAPAEYQLPPGIKVVDADVWEGELIRSNVLDPKGSNPRSRFREIRQALVARSLIGSRDNVVWLAQPY